MTLIETAPAASPNRSNGSAGHRTQPLLRIRPTSGWPSLNLAETWQFRDLLFSLAGRDLKLRYKQTALGAVWVILQPLLGAGVFSFVFGKVAGFTAPNGGNYFVFSYAGLLAWNLFSNSLSKTTSCLVGNAHLISKVYFPRLILPLSTIPSTLVDFAVAVAMLAVMMIVWHQPIGLSILLFPVWVLLLVLLGIGIGLCTASMSVKYRDIQYIMGLVMQLLMYGSPVAYAASKAIEKIGPTWAPFYSLNPLVGLLEAFRWSILNNDAPAAPSIVYASIVSTGVFILGIFAFKRMERSFADVI